MAANSGGKPPRRSVTASGAPKPRVTKVTTVSATQRRSSFKSVESWDRKSAGKWATKQSTSLNPGSEQAVARRRNTKKYVARTKKVIRPRVRKQQTG